ncbi:hypothetical protein VDGL01_09900 [Verticillium dahliae]
MSEQPRRTERKRDRKKENFAKSMRSLMKRLLVINEKYDADIYFCAKYSRWFEFSTDASLPPTSEQIGNAYPLTFRRTATYLREQRNTPKGEPQRDTR